MGWVGLGVAGRCGAAVWRTVAMVMAVGQIVSVIECQPGVVSCRRGQCEVAITILSQTGKIHYGTSAALAWLLCHHVA